MQQLNLFPTQHHLTLADRTDNPSDNWYTPDTPAQPVLTLVTEVLRTIDLDPCSDPDKHVPAKKHYIFADDGLVQKWRGKVFLNPPYAKPEGWVLKLCQEFSAGNVPEAVGLFKIGVLNNKGTGRLIKEYASAVCHWNERINFIPGENLLEQRRLHGKGKLNGADFDTVFVYFGDYPDVFEEVFEDYGMVNYLPRTRGR